MLNPVKPAGTPTLPAIMMAITLLSGCASSSYVLIDAQPPQRAVDSLAVGDRARINTTDGQTIEIVVASVDEDAVIGEEQRVPIEEIATVAILVEQDSSDTTAEISRVVWTYALIGYLVALAF